MPQSTKRSLTNARSTLAIGLALALLAACGGKATSPSTEGPGTSDPTTTLSAEVASYDLVSNEPNRLLIGVFSTEGVVSYGSIPVTFAYMGTADQPEATPEGPFETTASFILVPPEVGHEHSGDEGEEDHAMDSGGMDAAMPTSYSDEELQAAQDREPELTQPTDAKGVYQASDVVFDKPGYWQAATTITFADGTSGSATAAFEVVAKPAYPAIGSKAPASENLVMEDIGGKVKAAAVDSRATETGEVVDPSLHEVRIADAIKAGDPVVVVVSTPTYCQSRFCGPITDEIEGLQETYGDKARFVHLELWNDYQDKAINKAASQWVYRNGDITEPWVFLVGSDGTIVDRWSNVLDPRELASQLEAMPAIGG